MMSQFVHTTAQQGGFSVSAFSFSFCFSSVFYFLLFFLTQVLTEEVCACTRRVSSPTKSSRIRLFCCVDVVSISNKGRSEVCIDTADDMVAVGIKSICASHAGKLS